MPDRYDLTILADCPELLKACGWQILDPFEARDTGKPSPWVKYDGGFAGYHTLKDATAADRREAIGLLVERLIQNGWGIEGFRSGGKCKARAFSASCNLFIDPDPLHALHAAYVATKGK